jgi:hypothetical protein
MSTPMTLTSRIVPRRIARMLTACAWCERIRLDDRWVDPQRAIAQLRTYEWKRPPQFTHGICERCLEDVERRRSTANAAH